MLEKHEPNEKLESLNKRDKYPPGRREASAEMM